MEHTIFQDKNGNTSSKRIAAYLGLFFAFGMIGVSYFVKNDFITTQLVLGVLGLSFASLGVTLFEKPNNY